VAERDPLHPYFSLTMPKNNDIIVITLLGRGKPVYPAYRQAGVRQASNLQKTM